jgi:hypothetical protein
MGKQDHDRYKFQITRSRKEESSTRGKSRDGLSVDRSVGVATENHRGAKIELQHQEQREELMEEKGALRNAVDDE